ncbi:MAG: SDR family oxidoreductase [Desulfosarcinaceae bacterium]
MGYFQDKKILITGGGSGVGRRMALTMAREGATLIIWDIDQTALDRVLEELRLASSREHFGYVCDVSDSGRVYQTAETVRREAGEVDVLINNAGVVNGKGLLDCSDSEISRTMAINTMALFWTTRAFLPSMIQRNSGHVVTVASAGGLIGAAKLTDYSASKFAAVGFDEALRAELSQSAPGVKTTVICPFYINTGMFAGVRTRFPFLLPILDESYAAERMVRAIERRRPRLIMPPLVYVIPLLRMLPVPAFDWVAGFFGVNVSMQHFTGRTANKGEEEHGA